jgi:hypothetical protein
MIDHKQNEPGATAIAALALTKNSLQVPESLASHSLTTSEYVLPPRVLNKKADAKLIKDLGDQAVYVGRPTFWGNPFKIGRDGDRDKVCDLFAKYYASEPALQARIGELKGKSLVCFCKPARCHADFLLEVAK